MEAIVLLIVLLIIVLPIVAVCVAEAANSRAGDLAQRVDRLAKQVANLEAKIAQRGHQPEASPEPHAACEQPNQPNWTPPVSTPPPVPERPPALPLIPPRPTALPLGTLPAIAPALWEESKTPQSARSPAPPLPPKEPINWEHFLGIKLFAWAGGLALFFGIVFFVKYAFDHNLIPPSARATIGYILSIGLVASGARVFRSPTYRILGQTLCATGIVSLYGVTFACHAHYRFPLFNVMTTALIMAGITTLAFLLAVRMPAQVVAVLGILGGFLTPPLVSTGQDNPAGLFTFIALLDLGVLAIVRRMRWSHLAPLAALGTAILSVSWLAKFFVSEHYYLGAKTFVPCGVFLFFVALFSVFAERSWRREKGQSHHVIALLTVCLAGFFAAMIMFGRQEVAHRPSLLLGFVLLLGIPAQLAAIIQPRHRIMEISSALVLCFFAVWTCRWLTPALLPSALCLYLLVGLTHTALPWFIRRWQLEIPGGSTVSALAPLATSGLILLPMVVHQASSFIIWPALLLANLLGMMAAARARHLWPLAISMGLTLCGANLWMDRLPGPASESWLPFLAVIAGFGLLFLLAANWLCDHLRAGDPLSETDQLLAKFLPVGAAIAPFGLIILALMAVRLADPSAAFAVASLFLALLLGRVVWARQPELIGGGLWATLFLCGTWYADNFQPSQPWPILLWSVAFYAVFAAFPFVFRRWLPESILPWATAALAGVGYFVLVHDLIRRAFPNEAMGLVPAAFAVPALASLFAISKRAATPLLLAQLSWFGGVVLFFLTLIIPIQLERHWITVGWAMEGAALCWLFRRLPHRGLWLTALGLLAVVFGRLTFNPALVIHYGVRGPTPIWNWQLYTYGIAATSCFLAAYWLRASTRLWDRVNVSAWLAGMGGVLLFLLLNIEIADAFAEPGARFAFFRLHGSLGQDMMYSIGWAVFALALVMLGLRFDARAARYAGISLMLVTLAKLFLYDLSTISQVYRIAAFMGVAVVALAASFVYQRALKQPS